MLPPLEELADVVEVDPPDEQAARANVAAAARAVPRAMVFHRAIVVFPPYKCDGGKPAGATARTVLDGN